MAEERTADDIYQAVGILRGQLEQLAEQGRIVMTQDRHNTGHRDSARAIAAALAGLDQARDAMVWMETLATMDGEYPMLRG